MKKVYNFNGQINDTELTSAEKLDIAIYNCMRDYEHNLKALKLLTEAYNNKKNIAKDIEQSQTHMMATELGFAEIHYIAFVEGEAVLIKSLAKGHPFRHDLYDHYDRITFVYGKRYNRFNYMDFHADVLKNGGLDSVWCDFEFSIIM